MANWVISFCLFITSAIAKEPNTQEQDFRNHFSTLPKELATKIFLELDFPSALKLSCANKHTQSTFSSIKKDVLENCSHPAVLPKHLLKQVYEEYYSVFTHQKSQDDFLIAVAISIYDVNKEYPQYPPHPGFWFNSGFWINEEDPAALLLAVHYLDVVFDRASATTKLDAALTFIKILEHFNEVAKKHKNYGLLNAQKLFKASARDRQVGAFFRAIVFNPLIRAVFPKTQGLEKVPAGPNFAFTFKLLQNKKIKLTDIYKKIRTFINDAHPTALPYTESLILLDELHGF